MSNPLDFSGQAVLVTGGSNGIGQAIAQSFRDAGAAVTITGTRPAPTDYESDLSSFTYRQAQMDDASCVESLIAAMERVDVLVNNAGTAVDPPESLTPEGFERNMAINLNAVFRLSRGLHGALSKRPGCIINIASMYSYFGSDWGPAYGASKSAIVNLTKSLAVLYASDGIRVNAIAPGWIETKLTASMRDGQGGDSEVIERTPMGRWGRPDEVAGTALFLSSDALAGFVTGTTIPVDGGYSSK
jgi:NAD(P)-dependent dehydrogenase (short-subunit alcohol dehydrogenase family)